MTSASKRKGSGAERDVVAYLREHGFPHAERRLAGSAQDRGDIAGMPGIVVEIKNCARTDLGGWVDEAVLEQANDAADYGVVWHKRRGKVDAGQWYATLPAAQLVRLLRAAGYGEPLDALSATLPAQNGPEVVPEGPNPPEAIQWRQKADPEAIRTPSGEAWAATGGA